MVYSWFKWLFARLRVAARDIWRGTARRGRSRSPDWVALSRKVILEIRRCEVCGSKKGLEVHHKLPFHLHPELELVRVNLCCLCRRCHLFVGHLGTWSSYNPEIDRDMKIWARKIRMRP